MPWSQVCFLIAPGLWLSFFIARRVCSIPAFEFVSDFFCPSIRIDTCVPDIMLYVSVMFIFVFTGDWSVKADYFLCIRNWSMMAGCLLFHPTLECHGGLFSLSPAVGV